MGTTAEKLQAIVAAKADIGAAITEKGGTVPERFSEYGNAIRALPSGDTPLAEPLDAQRVYAALRDTSWPPMPQDIPDHTVVMLLAPESSVDFFVTCEGQYTVTVQQCILTDGQWSYTEELVENVDSAAAFAHAYTEADGSNFRLLTISGVAITAFSFSGLSDGTEAMPGVLEFWSHLSSIKKLNSFTGMKDLTWVKLISDTSLSLSAVSPVFASCASLIAVIAPNVTLNNTSASSHIFRNCASLLAVNIRFTNQTSMSFVRGFLNCRQITAVRGDFFSCASNMGTAFIGCISLKHIEIESVYTAICSFMGTFDGCVSLEKVKISGSFKLGINMGNCFRNCISLKSLVFDLPNWTGSVFSIANCAFQRSGLVEMFQSLPTIATPKEITITGNPGVAELTDADKAIATDKGWVLVE